MRKYAILLIVASVLLTSCKDDEPLPLTPDLVTSVKAYDLDNNGNSSDIRVDFRVENNLNIREYRIMVIPTNSTNLFDQSVAVSISKDNYLVIDPVPFETEYSINRLPTTLPDVNGSLIINDIEYVVVILVEGTGNFQLSEFSIPFTLKDQGIYTGYYEGLGEFADQHLFGNRLSVQLFGSGGNYQGAMEVIYTSNNPDTTMSNIRFNVVDDIISNIIVSGGENRNGRRIL